ncbi:hypothetical protein Q4I30_001914 [Leishmania utingensis]|uniref:SMP-LTD domain-containing protein n=1 Tax=Leishmania utingensis TaxID=653362 RepID=A0AAW3AW36_9TRYP
MDILTLLTFLYGAIGGAVSCVFLFFILFRKAEAVLSDTVRNMARKHVEFDAVAKEAVAVAPAKVETLCKVVRFDDGIVDEAIQCRMVFYSGTIDIYQVDKLRTLPDHRQEVVSEHMLGRIHRACIIATAQRISKYHRHRNQNTRYAAIKGRCTVLSHKDGMPLFLEDPNTILKEKLQRVAEQQRQEAMIESLFHRGRCDSKAMANEEFSAEMKHIESETRKERHSYYTMGASGRGNRHDLMGIDAATTISSGAFHQSGSIPGCRGKGLSAGALGEVPLSQWRCVAIKFPTRRVQERWLNLLQSTPQSTQWQDFITHLPQMDVFNLLIARLFFENTRANTLHDLLEEKIKKKLARVSKSLPPQLRGNIFLDGLDVGGEIPLISNVSDPAPSKSGDTEFDFDVLYRGGLALKIRFSILYRDIRVPDIIFSIKVLELAGRVHFVVGPPPTRKLWLGGPQPPQLRLEFTQEVASHDGILNAVLRLLPDMSKIASNIVKVMLFEDMVFPNMDDFPLPVFGEDSDDDDDDSATVHSGVEDVANERNTSRTHLGSSRSGDDNEAERERQDSSSCTAGGAANENSGSQSGVTPRKGVTPPWVSLSSAPAVERSAHSQHVTFEMTSPPPRPPIPHSASTSGKAAPRAHPDGHDIFSSGRRSSTQSSQSQPLRSLPGETSPLPMRTSPTGLPPRPPRAPSSELVHRAAPQVPKSRAPLCNQALLGLD